MGYFSQKSPIISGSYAKRDLQLKAFYASLSPCYLYLPHAMGWLRLVGPLQTYVFFAEYRLFHRALLQKRRTIWWAYYMQPHMTLSSEIATLSSQTSYWDSYASFDEQRLFSIKFARFCNFFNFAQIWGILASDKFREIQCWQVADGKDESW